MSYVERKYFVLPADREEVKRGISMFILARSDALDARREFEAYGAVGMFVVEGRGRGLVFEDRPEQGKIAGLGRATFIEEANGWVAVPDKRTAAGKNLNDRLYNAADLQDIWQWSLEKSLGIYGLVSSGFPTVFHPCFAKPLADGRVIVSTPVAKNRPIGEGCTRNFDDPVIPDWAVSISAEEYKALDALPELGLEGVVVNGGVV